MSAAGWGGLGTVQQPRVMYSISACRVLRTGTDGVAFSASASPAVFRTNRTAAASKVDALASGGMDDYEIPAFLRKQPDSSNSKPAFDDDRFTPEQLLEKFNDMCLITTKFSDITWELTESVSDGFVWKVLCDIAEGKDKIELHWACLIRWLANEVPGIVSLTRHSQRIINAQVASIDAASIQEIEAKFVNAFPGITKSSWGQTSAAEKRSLLSRFKKLMTGG